ncbi:MAG: MFS transporter [Candidatus Pelagadaptatus aseana]
MRYHLAAALAALAMGVQTVVVPWIAVGDLQLSSLQMGWLQFFSLFPVVILMLSGGAFADRQGSAPLLPYLYLTLAVLHLGLLWLINQQALIVPLLFVYAMLAGSVSTLIQPLRDRVLPEVQDRSGQTSLQISVIQMSLAIYVAQALGVALAGQREHLGIQWILTIQIVAVMLVAALMYSLNLGKQGTDTGPVITDSTAEDSSVREGLRFVFGHKVLRQLIVLVGFNGFTHIGVYVVAMPLLVRDAYGESGAFFAGLQLAFVVGNVVATLGLLKKGDTHKPGQSILFCLLYTGLIMIALSAGPNERGLFFLIFCWGVVAGISASLGKALLHEQVEEEYRGRALSVYLLALFGAAPLGALVCGYTMQFTGPLQLFWVGGCFTLLVFVRYLFARSLWKA